jgi:hypothetical protein
MATSCHTRLHCSIVTKTDSNAKMFSFLPANRILFSFRRLRPRVASWRPLVAPQRPLMAPPRQVAQTAPWISVLVRPRPRRRRSSTPVPCTTRRSHPPTHCPAPRRAIPHGRRVPSRLRPVNKLFFLLFFR